MIDVLLFIIGMLIIAIIFLLVKLAQLSAMAHGLDMPSILSESRIRPYKDEWPSVIDDYQNK